MMLKKIDEFVEAICKRMREERRSFGSLWGFAEHCSSQMTEKEKKQAWLDHVLERGGECG